MNDARVRPSLESDSAAREYGRQLALDGLLLQALADSAASEESGGFREASRAPAGRGSRRALWAGLAAASLVLGVLAVQLRRGAPAERVEVVEHRLPRGTPEGEPGEFALPPAETPAPGRGAGEERKNPAPPLPPDARWTISFRLSLTPKDGKWVFAIDGTTNIPPEVQLRARIYAVEVFSDFLKGEREDDEPLVWDDDGAQASYCRFSAARGTFHEAVYRFSRKPYSIRYRAKIDYVASEQTEPVRLRLGDEDFSRKADLRVGSDADYEQELKERVQEVADDLKTAQKLYGECSDALASFRKSWNADSWKEWKEPWLARLEALSRKNDQRYSLWVVWMERQAKMRVNGLCDLLRHAQARAEEQFTEGAKNQDHIEELLKAFQDYFEEAIEVIGISAPLDVRRVGPIVAAYEKAIDPLRAWTQKPVGDLAAILRAARRQGFAALLELPPLLKNRKSGYFYVNELSVRLTRLLEILDAASSFDERKRALEEHDAALASFKDFAGLK